MKNRTGLGRMGYVLLAFVLLAAHTACVKETQTRKITPTTHKQLRSKAKADQERGASRAGPLVCAVMLDPAPYLPSVYSQEGLDALVAALQEKGLRVWRASGWDDLSETKRGVKRLKAELVIIVAFRDMPDLATATVEAPQQECACRFYGSVVEVASGRVLNREEVEHQGAPDHGFEKACHNAVLASVRAYSEVAAHIIGSYEAGTATGGK